MRSGRKPPSRKKNVPTPAAGKGEAFRNIKQSLREELLKVVDFEKMASSKGEELNKRLRMTLMRLIEVRNIPLGRAERERAVTGRAARPQRGREAEAGPAR